MWDSFTLIGLPIAGFFTLLAGGFACWSWYRWHRLAGNDPDFNRPLWLTLAIILSVVTAIITIATLVTYYPFNSAYHYYKPTSGKVTAIASRLAGNGATQKYVLTLDGSPQQYGVSDTRAALLHVGDTVHLRCIRVYQYGSNDAGYDCLWSQ